MKLDAHTALTYGSAQQAQAALQADYGICIPLPLLQVFAENAGAALAFEISPGTTVSILRESNGYVSTLQYENGRDYKAIAYAIKDRQFIAATWMADGSVTTTGA
jgi:hypothetical protein